MRTYITNNGPAALREDFVNFKFEFRTELATKEDKENNTWRGDILNQALKILEDNNYFDDYDDWEFTFKYESSNEEGDITYIATSIVVTLIVN